MSGGSKHPTHSISLHCVGISIMRVLNDQGHGSPTLLRKVHITLNRLKSQKQGHVMTFTGPRCFSPRGPLPP